MWYSCLRRMGFALGLGAFPAFLIQRKKTKVSYVFYFGQATFSLFRIFTNFLVEAFSLLHRSSPKPNLKSKKLRRQVVIL